MTDINITLFCSWDTSSRFTSLGSTLSRPFSIGEWTYATNGHCAIRVPRRDDVPENGDAPAHMATLFAPAETITFHPVALDLTARTRTRCATCHGRGPGIECEDCKGTGDHQCDCEHCDERCDECDGEGIIYGLKREGCELHPCHACEGSGYEPDRRRCHFAGKLVLSAHLVTKVIALPGPIEMGAAAGGTPSKYGAYIDHPPQFFRGPGWTAIVMPMRWCDPIQGDVIMPEAVCE